MATGDKGSAHRGLAGLAYAAVLTGLAVFCPVSDFAAAAPSISAGPMPLEIRSRPLPGFRISDSEAVIFDGLEWLGGLELWSGNRHFGALSGLSVSEDGGRIVAVTDNGFWIRATIEQDAEGRPTALSGATIAPMLDKAGNVLNLKASADAESVAPALWKGRPVYVVAFERKHRVELYDRPLDERTGRPTRLPVPRGVRRLSANKGIEAVAIGRPGTRHAGAIVLIAERPRRGGGKVPAWTVREDGRSWAFDIVRRDNFDVTDAAFLPDGDLLILERRFSFSDGIYMRLRRISGGAIRPGRTADGTIVATADFLHQIDNMEGLAVHVDATGRVILTLVSDDNRSILQRTLLLRFRLRTPMLEVTPRPRPPDAHP